MFKIGETPSPSADAIEHADFLELECLRQSDRNASGADLIAALSRLTDDLPEDRADQDLRMEAIVDDAFSELQCRRQHVGLAPYRYPFAVRRGTRLLQFTGRPGHYEFYLFLLLATRMNMRENRVQADINGTELFEEICCEVAKRYWGRHANGLVFGTARRAGDDEVGNFDSAVNDLCHRLGEGQKFHNHWGQDVTAQDGNLDIVVWKDFTDNLVGKLIGFGQCKTGRHWSSGLFDLEPPRFCKKWVLTQPAVDPVRLYFITSRVRRSKWYEVAVDGGILFDRCRIMDYAPVMEHLRTQWTTWVQAALAANRLAVP